MTLTVIGVVTTYRNTTSLRFWGTWGLGLITDCQEVDTDKIDWEADGTILPPTISDCLEFGDKTYAEDGLERFKSG